MKNWRTSKPISLYNVGFKLLAVFTCHHTSHHGCWPKPTTPRDSLVGWCIIVPGKIAGFQGMFPQPDDLSICPFAECMALKYLAWIHFRCLQSFSWGTEVSWVRWIGEFWPIFGVSVEPWNQVADLALNPCQTLKNNLSIDLLLSSFAVRFRRCIKDNPLQPCETKFTQESGSKWESARHLGTSWPTICRTEKALPATQAWQSVPGKIPEWREATVTLKSHNQPSGRTR